MAYWDEIEEETLKQGIPDIFLQREYTFADNTKIPNPLYSYRFQAGVTDRLPRNPNDPYDYSKHTGYETVRYPFSGLVGTEQDRAKTEAHNQVLIREGDVECNRMLNKNIITWLNLPLFLNDRNKEVTAGIKDKFVACMKAPNYTVFSNTTSAQRWNDDRKDTTGETIVVPLESPHNSIHLAVGGFEIMGEDGKSYNVYTGANGDMGENDTASFDPCFYFHHAWIDLVFSLWQAEHGGADSLQIIEAYPGTNSVDSQGPTPGVAGGTWLTLDSPLSPFKKAGNATEEYSSRDVADISKLNYSYEYSGELKPKSGKFHAPNPSDDLLAQPAPVLTVGNISRERIGGSFIVSAWAKPKNGQGDYVLVGTEAVLSRQKTSGCNNCQLHQEVRTHVPLHGFNRQRAMEQHFEVIVHTRDGKAPKRPGLDRNIGDELPVAGGPQPSFQLNLGHLGGSN